MKILATLLLLIGGAHAGEHYFCNLNALSKAERARHQELSRALQKAAAETAELPNGYGFRLGARELPLAAEWVGFESRCCPFFGFELALARDQGPLWLRITGGSDGIKAFIRAEFGLWSGGDHKHSQVGQPLESSLVPLGQLGAQPSAGQTTPVGGEGAGPDEGSEQLHWQGGQASPGAQAGQAQPQPVDGGGVEVWHTPDTQVWPTMQGAPSANHWQWSVVSPVHEALSVKALQGSLPLLLMLVVVLLVVPVGAGTGPVPPQPQAQGAQLVPGAQSGQAHTQVPWSTQPEPPPSLQLQAQGGQASPGAQGGQAQVQLPPALPPPLQSHSGGGQVAPCGQASGVTQPQLPPLESLGWQ
jgi:hypothetical protein